MRVGANPYTCGRKQAFIHTTCVFPATTVVLRNENVKKLAGSKVLFFAEMDRKTYIERWGDKKQAFVRPCDWRNLKFGLFASVFIAFLHFCSLQKTVRVKGTIFLQNSNIG